MPGAEDTYHWAIITGPKTEVEDGRGMRYHAKERPSGPGKMEWFFEEREVPLAATNMLLVRVMIGKVEKRDRLINILRSVPIRQNVQGWNCVWWVKEALELLRADGKALGTSILEWKSVRDCAMAYCQAKKDKHRFDGKVKYDMTKAATFDLIEGKETIP
ncbi:hypothetical protein L228DRAFT_249337 [Xylona heveae TC161]|uniref:Uncharacterized protein n=1 Tax=Xylona heveae (strain CBS 132557 / TC161) TaxID=1328760 RepID=A0A165AJJ5_XYLHT|nr:hypothetical protein L228DRAFT_249337 [Xylona heveae TC161]KZF20584.1 hypothetical protein L228DRAFT_249337 [Xylona heveae TC161]